MSIIQTLVVIASCAGWFFTHDSNWLVVLAVSLGLGIVQAIERLERLTSLFYNERDRGDRAMVVDGSTDAMQAALRSLTADPKPDEPQEPGARAFCEISGERTEWARVRGQIKGQPGEHWVWVNGYGGRRTWEQLAEDYAMEVQS